MLNKKWFTLIELIVVIWIIAVMWTIAVLWVQSWIWTSRDAARWSNLDQIISALEISMYNNTTLPMPDSSIPITASGTMIWYQWTFCDGAVAWTTLKSVPKDPTDKKCFSYYVDATKTKYQLMAMYEKDSSDISYNISEKVYAAATKYPKVKWDKLGIMTDMSNTPVNEIATWVDVVNTTNTYKAYFKNDDYISWTWLTLFTNIYNRNSSLVKNSKDLALYDNNLLWYWDMETMSWTKLKDFSKYHNDWTPTWVSTPLNWKVWKSIYFDWTNTYITLPNTINLANQSFTVSLWVNWLTWVFLSQWSFLANTELVIHCMWDSRWLTFAFYWNDYKSLYDCWNMSNVWNFISVSYDSVSKTRKLYINNNLYWTNLSTSNYLWNSNLYLWQDINWWYKYKWSIDEVRIYNRVLLDSEIQSLYNSSNSN